MTLWKDLLKKYEQTVHILVFSGLSGSCQTALMLVQDYEDQVFAVNNQRTPVTQRQSVMGAKAMADRGMNGREIQRMLEDTRFDPSIYTTMNILKYPRKGGRATPAAVAPDTLLKTKPVLTIQGEKLDTFSKARAMEQTKSTMITTIARDMEKRFGDEAGEGLYLEVAHTANEEAAMGSKRELEEISPEVEKVYVNALPLSVSCHVGPGAPAVACMKKLGILKGG